MTTAAELWRRIKPILRQRGLWTPETWQSVEAAVPVTVDENTFVLGLSPENEPFRSALESATMLALIRQGLKELTGQEYQVVVIVGTAEEDWHRHKARQKILRRLATQTVEWMDARTATVERKDWRWLTNQIAHDYATLPRRQYDYVKAQFLLDCAERVSEFEEEFLKERSEGGEEEVVRELERLIQRLAGMTGLPPAIVAMEIERARRRRKKERVRE